MFPVQDVDFKTDKRAWEGGVWHRREKIDFEQVSRPCESRTHRVHGDIPFQVSFHANASKKEKDFHPRMPNPAPAPCETQKGTEMKITD